MIMISSAPVRFGRTLGHLQSFFQAMRHDGVRRDEASGPGEHDVEPSVEHAWERLEGAPAHDHRLAHGDLPEIAHVAAQVPGQVPSPADGAVLAHGDDQRDDRLGRRPPLKAHTATLALMAGCGS